MKSRLLNQFISVQILHKKKLDCEVTIFLLNVIQQNPCGYDFQYDLVLQYTSHILWNVK